MNWPHKDRTQWHRWFAWYPVVIGQRWVWLETVERQCGETFCGDYINYRAVARAERRFIKTKGETWKRLPK